MSIRAIIGLGNPGPQYEATRHNVGFWLVDALARQQACSWQREQKFQAE
ncbi:MAG: aminoacyl-tRNA hydrolase, partial [Burkholderiaceae bacterium]